MDKTAIKEAIEYFKTLLELYNKGVPLTFTSGEADRLDTLLKAIEEKDKQIHQLEYKLNCCEKVHDYDVKMIDEVKGEVVELYKQIDSLKEKNEVQDLEVINKFLDLCEGKFYKILGNLTVINKGIEEDTAKGRRQVFVIERQVEKEE